jgi:hypothetical protein
MQQVRIGCSGWSYRDWRGGLYPDGLPPQRWLERYAEVFDTVEVNATFYRLPKRSTVESWVEQVPGDFLFAVKASRYLTHMKRLREITDAVARFWEPLEPLRRGHRLGPVLWQLPANFHRDDDLLASALDELPPANHCFEFPIRAGSPPRCESYWRSAKPRWQSATTSVDRCPKPSQLARSPTCACTTATAVAAATTPRPSSTTGGAGSPPGARGDLCSSTSITTGGATHPPMPAT